MLETFIRQLRGHDKMAVVRGGRECIHLSNALVDHCVLGKTGHFAQSQLDKTLLSLLRVHLCTGETDLLLGYQSLAFDLPHKLQYSHYG
jgi:hypothetical protein